MRPDAAATPALLIALCGRRLPVRSPAWITDYLDYAEHFNTRFTAALKLAGRYILAPQANDEENR